MGIFFGVVSIVFGGILSVATVVPFVRMIATLFI